MILRRQRYQRFFSRCSAEDTSGEKEKINYGDEFCCLSHRRAGHFEDSKPETAHEKPLAPRINFFIPQFK